MKNEGTDIIKLSTEIVSSFNDECLENDRFDSYEQVTPLVETVTSILNQAEQIEFLHNDARVLDEPIREAVKALEAARPAVRALDACFCAARLGGNENEIECLDDALLALERHLRAVIANCRISMVCDDKPSIGRPPKYNYVLLAIIEAVKGFVENDLGRAFRPNLSGYTEIGGKQSPSRSSFGPLLLHHLLATMEPSLLDGQRAALAIVTSEK